MADRDLRINIDVKSTGKGEIVELRQEMQRFETGIDELKASIKQAEDAFEAQRATSIALKSEYKQLNREGKGTREMFEDLSQQIEKSQAAELEAIQNTRKLIAELNELDGETGEVAAEFGDLGQRLNEAEGWITGVTQEVRTMGQGFQNVSGDVQEVGSEVREVGQHARRAADGIDKLGDDASRSADQLEKLTGGAVKFSAIGNIIADGVQDAARAVVEFAKESVQAFYDFERSSREIFTLIPGASAEMREALTKDALALGTELGRLPDEILPSIYNALSAGVPQDNVLETVRVASDAARAGVADLDSTLKLGLGILNAQVGGVSNLSDVYDQLFFIVKNGVITLPELNTVMSQVTSIAGEAGVSMQDISAAMITMTRQGDTAAEAAELLSIMLTQLSTAGTTLATVFEEAAGKSFRQFVAEGGTLAEAMQLLQDHANNTGQALGDILGGGSPFFRDTQAARGALELTGKHLEELVKFGEEAEDQLGAMAEAGAEMGEAAELGALQATAAFEEFKIAAGELASEGLAPVYAGLTTTLKLLSGNLGNQVDSMTDDIVEQAKATGDYESAAQRLAKALDTAYSTEGRAFVSDETRADLNNSLNEIYVNLAKNSDSVEEFQAALDALDVSGLYKPANAQELFDAAQAEKFAESLENIDQKMFSVAQHAQELNEQPIEFSPEQLEEMSAGLDRVDEKLFHLAETAVSPSFHEAVVLKEEMIAADEQAAAVAEDRAARIAAAAAEEQAAILANRQAYNQTALAVLNGAEAETNFKDALFQTSAQLGINPGQFRELAEASGEYSEAQIRAAVTEAAMKQAVDELSAALVAGDITVDEAIQSLEDFEAALAGDFTATLEYDDFVQAEQQAHATKAALLGAEGNYSASFTTTNTTVNEVVTKYSSSGQPAAQANYSGGRFQPGQFLIVGDGPGGQILPTTELVVFDQPGRVFSGRETAEILSQAGLGGPGEPFLGDSGAASPGVASVATEQRPIVVQVSLPNVQNGHQFVGELDEALVALQRQGLSN